MRIQYLGGALFKMISESLTNLCMSKRIGLLGLVGKSKNKRSFDFLLAITSLGAICVNEVNNEIMKPENVN